jgi:hypothetical protein
MKFDTAYFKTTSECEFREHFYSDSHTLTRISALNNFLPVTSKYHFPIFVKFGRAYFKTLSSKREFRKNCFSDSHTSLRITALNKFIPVTFICRGWFAWNTVIRYLHLTTLRICEFPENRSREGRTFCMAINKITCRCYHETVWHFRNKKGLGNIFVSLRTTHSLHPFHYYSNMSLRHVCMCVCIYMYIYFCSFNPPSPPPHSPIRSTLANSPTCPTAIKLS